jgi:hypothetical protein
MADSNLFARASDAAGSAVAQGRRYAEEEAERRRSRQRRITELASARANQHTRAVLGLDRDLVWTRDEEASTRNDGGGVWHSVEMETELNGLRWTCYVSLGQCRGFSHNSSCEDGLDLSHLNDPNRPTSLDASLRVHLPCPSCGEDMDSMGLGEVTNLADLGRLFDADGRPIPGAWSCWRCKPEERSL